MSNVSDILSEELWSELRFKSELGKCAGPCGESALDWLTFGAVVYPLLFKHGLQKYVGFRSRFLIVTFSAVLTSFYMGYRSKTKCEENIKRIYAEQKEKALEKLKKGVEEKEALKKAAS